MQFIKKTSLMIFCGCLSFSACKKEFTEEQIIAESKKANEFFERVFDESVDRQPMMQTILGLKKDYDKWDDISDEFNQKELDITRKELSWLKSEINYDALDPQTKISYDLFVLQSEQEVDNFKFRFHNYPVNQMFGLQSGVPSFLINMHRVSEIKDLGAYVSRLEKTASLFEQLINNLKIREEKDIIPPKFVFAHVLRDCRNIISGTTLIDDFKSKLDAQDDLAETERKDLLNQAEHAIRNSVIPSYEKLIAYLTELEKKAPQEGGAWSFPDGEAFYNSALKRVTTTNLTAQEIHDIGLKEVDRIHGEMNKIMQKVGFQGTLQEFFEFMRNDSQFYLSNSDSDKEKYLQDAKNIINAMQARLDELFITKPKAGIIVKAVEPFREKSAGKAFYQQPSMDGSRPGTFYANLYDMKEMPTYQLEALAYHEGIPGHHMQIAIAQELEEIPMFRKFGRFTAYVEGWGLYTEYLPKELGFYSDPYSDFGRLAMELWRACRLVVDTGIHAKKWTRQQGIDYYKENTPNPEGDCVKMVERHIVMPGQATAYKIGMLKILELREQAKEQLGDAFDIREFHDAVLTNGPVPLSVLEKIVKELIASKQS